MEKKGLVQAPRKTFVCITNKDQSNDQFFVLSYRQRCRWRCPDSLIKSWISSIAFRWYDSQRWNNIHVAFAYECYGLSSAWNANFHTQSRPKVLSILKLVSKKTSCKVIQTNETHDIDFQAARINYELQLTRGIQDLAFNLKVAIINHIPGEMFIYNFRGFVKKSPWILIWPYCACSDFDMVLESHALKLKLSAQVLDPIMKSIIFNFWVLRLLSSLRGLSADNPLLTVNTTTAFKPPPRRH